MQIRDIQSALTTALTRVKGPYDHAAIQAAAPSLAAVLALVPELGNEFSGSMRAMARGAHRVDFENLALTLLSHAAESGVHQAIEDLEWYASSSSFPVRQALFLTGVTLFDKAELGEGVWVGPFKVPDPGRWVPGHGSPRLGYSSHRGNWIWRDIDHPKAFSDESPRDLPDLWDFSALEDAIRCISLIGPCGPAVTGSSIAPARWIPSVGGPLGEVPHWVEQRASPTLTAEQLSEAARIHVAFTQLPTTMKARYRAAMKRLNWSQRRQWNVDRAFDLGIAAEIVLTDQKPTDASITFTLRIRASRYLGSTREEREAVFDTLGRMYTLRSSAVHDGALPDAINGITSEAIMDEAAGLIAASMRRMLLEGEPDWKKLVLE
jgi:hypothetical protein